MMARSAASSQANREARAPKRRGPTGICHRHEHNGGVHARTRERLARLGKESVASLSGDIEQLARHSVGPGVVDPLVVLVLRAVRRLWAPLLVFGVAWVVVAGELDAAADVSFDSIGDYLRALLSPFAGIVLAIGIRVLTTVLGSAAATPRAVAEHRHNDPRRWSVLRSPGDVTSLVAAYRLLRFTTSARDVAVERLGAAGRVFLVVDRVESWLVPIGLIAVAAAVALPR